MRKRVLHNELKHCGSNTSRLVLLHKIAPQGCRFKVIKKGWLQWNILISPEDDNRRPFRERAMMTAAVRKVLETTVEYGGDMAKQLMF